jgi:short-subunit dehydrogenase
MGRELVLLLLSRGARVAAVDRSEEGLAGTVSRSGAAANKVSTHVTDVTDRAAVQALPAAVIEAHGAVDGLLHNAGIIQPFVPVVDLDYDAIRRVLNVNLWGTIHVTKAFLPALLARPQAHLACVSSMGGFFPFPGQTVYGASKAAVKLYTEGLYAELLDTGVTVSVIMPGAVATSISENSGVAAPGGAAAAESGMEMTSAPEAARIILDGIERDKLHIYVGKDARFMNAAIKTSPERAIRYIKKKMDGLTGG